MKNLGEKLRQLRENAKLSQEAVAEQIGVSNGMISLWESNTNEPKASFIIKLANFYGVSTDYLLSQSDEVKYIPPKQLARDIDKLPREERQAVDDLIAMLLRNQKQS